MFDFQISVSVLNWFQINTINFISSSSSFVSMKQMKSTHLRSLVSFVALPRLLSQCWWLMSGCLTAALWSLATAAAWYGSDMLGQWAPGQPRPMREPLRGLVTNQRPAPASGWPQSTEAGSGCGPGPGTGTESPPRMRNTTTSHCHASFYLLEM